MSELYEKQISSKEIFNGKIFTVTVDEAETSDGKKVRRDIVHHPGGVVIVAENGEKILLVKQYRYPTGEVLIELPAGKLDKFGESPIEAAKRELREETGFIADNWQALGIVYSSPGFCSEKLYLYKATELSFQGRELDDDENLDYMSVKKNEVFQMMKDGRINDAKTLAALLRAYFL